jgi:general secretion pathway protein E
MTAMERQMPVAELKKGALTLAGFLDALRDEGKITEADCATALRSSQAAEHQGKHILEIVADFEFVDLQDNGRPLDVEQLTMALARQSGQPYYRIESLKVDVAQVTKLMNYKFSQRHEILAVEENPHGLTAEGGRLFELPKL